MIDPLAWSHILQVVVSAVVLFLTARLVDQAKEANKRSKALQGGMIKSLRDTLLVLDAQPVSAPKSPPSGSKTSATRATPSPTPAPRPKPRTALEIDKDERLAELSSFRNGILKWSRIANMGVDSIQQELDRFAAELGEARNSATVRDVRRKYEEYFADAIYRILRESDLQIDKDRGNQQLQGQLDGLLSLTGLSPIAPRRRERAEPRLHRTLGSRPRGPGDISGTIAAVTIRGLLRPNGDVFQKAEIEEFD